MNYKQPNQLIITRNNELDPDYLRQIKINKVKEVGGVLLHGFQTAGIVATEALGKLVTPMILEAHDAVHHSHLRDEYFQKLHDAATEEMRAIIDL